MTARPANLRLHLSVLAVLIGWVLLTWPGLLISPVMAESANPQISDLHEPRPAARLPRATQSILLGLTQTDSGFVAVGERGHVLLSSDGRAWRQADFVPVQATLTSVAAVGDRLWAVGHDTTIIYSRDGGQTWALQYFDPDLEMPLLGVHFFDRHNGLAIGAYGIYLVTEDGGVHWAQYDLADRVTSEAIDWEAAAELIDDFMDEGFDDFIDDDWFDEEFDAELDFDRGCYEFMECHLNAFLDLGDGRFMIAAERGYGFRSVDSGENWESFRFTYPGSMFGLIEVGDSIIAYGLRGHVQRSTDFGDSWEVLDSPVESSLLGATTDPDGRVLIVGASAARLTYDPATGRLSATEDRLGSAYSGVLVTADGRRILIGEEGAKHE